MKLRPILFMAAAVKTTAQQHDNLRRSRAGQQHQMEESTEHEDDPTELSEFSTDNSLSDQQLDTSALLKQLLVEVPDQQVWERKMKELKNKKKMEIAQRRLAIKHGVQAKRGVSGEHDPDELQFEVDDFAASIENFQAREERKAKRQEQKMLQ